MSEAIGLRFNALMASDSEPPTSQGVNLASLAASLELAREDEIPELDWLDASYTDPAAFWEGLIQGAAPAYPPPLRSRPGSSIDLYADTVGRHAGTKRVALRWFDRRLDWRQLSFAELDARAGSRATAWVEQGVGAGSAVALLLPLGPELLVSLAAALRLGARVSLLPPAHEASLAPRLAALGPDHLVFDPTHPPPVPREMAELRLEPGGTQPPPPAPPYSFAPDETCASLFTGLRAPLAVPAELSAEAALLHAWRDALLAYRLRPGMGLAAPGFHPRQHLPALLLSTLAAGATFIHIPWDDLLSDPALLTEGAVHVLGINRELCELLRRRPPGPWPELHRWFRPADEPLDWEAHREMIVKNDLARFPASNVLVDAASGGCVLFSAARPGSVNAKVLPAAGQPWTLIDPSTGEPALGEHGLFTPLREGEPTGEGWFVIAKASRAAREHLYGGPLVPRRAARVFPSSEVVELVMGLPGVAGASVVPVPTGSPGGDFAFVLLVFVGDGCVEAREIPGLLEQRLGPDGRADHVEIVPFFPRLEGEKVDHDWCRAQYLSGFLARKAEEPVFHKLTDLRRAALFG